MGVWLALGDALGIAASDAAARRLRVGECEPEGDSDCDGDADSDLEGAAERDALLTGSPDRLAL